MEHISGVIEVAERLIRMLQAAIGAEPLHRLAAQARGLSGSGKYALLPKQVVPRISSFFGRMSFGTTIGYDVVAVGSTEDAFERLFAKFDQAATLEEMLTNTYWILAACQEVKQAGGAETQPEFIQEALGCLQRTENRMQQLVDDRRAVFDRYLNPPPRIPNRRRDGIKRCW